MGQVYLCGFVELESRKEVCGGIWRGSAGGIAIRERGLT